MRTNLITPEELVIHLYRPPRNNPVPYTPSFLFLNAIPALVPLPRRTQSPLGSIGINCQRRCFIQYLRKGGRRWVGEGGLPKIK